MPHTMKGRYIMRAKNINTKYVAVVDGEIVHEFNRFTAALIWLAKAHRAGFGADIKPVVHGVVIDKVIWR